MEGLAGASSVIAVVSVAVQLADGLQKLITFWKEVQDAPAEISSLFEDLEALSLVLTQVQSAAPDGSLDESTDMALENCKSKVLQLSTKVSKANLELGSQSRTRRKWAGFKITLKRPEIESLRRSIEQAKSTLIIAKLKSIDTSTGLIYRLQGEILTEISQLRSNSSTIRVDITQNNIDSSQIKQIMQIYESGVLTPTDVTPSSETKDLHPSNEVSSRPSNRLLLRHGQFYISNQNWSFNTPFWSLRQRALVKRVSNRYASPREPLVEEDVAYVISPSGLLRWIGISRGVSIYTKPTAGWQFTLQPFTVIREESLIFEFCREGNLAGVQTLFKLGQASVRDRDPSGRTPLHVAARSLQRDVADFLLREGAGMHVGDWRFDSQPILAIGESTEVSVSKKISMIALFQSYCPDEFDEGELLHLMGCLFRFYRPAKYLEMTAAEKQDAALKVVKQLIQHFPREGIERAKILDGLLQFYYDQSVLHWTLKNIDGIICDSGSSSAIHDAISRGLLTSDPLSVEMIARKTADLHRFLDRQPSHIPPSTPTSLAMFRTSTFYTWVKIVKTLCDIEEFIRQELKSSPLRNEGWTEQSLTALFNTQPIPDLSPSNLRFPPCERCNQPGLYTWPMVDLAWRRRLGVLRNNFLRVSEFMDTPGKPSNVSPMFRVGEPAAQKVKGEFRLTDGNLDPSLTKLENLDKLLPYNRVCSKECTDGVCAARVFDSDFLNEPVLPPFPLETDFDIKKENDERCPTRRMPGAFED